MDDSALLALAEQLQRVGLDGGDYVAALNACQAGAHAIRALLDRVAAAEQYAANILPALNASIDAVKDPIAWAAKQQLRADRAEASAGAMRGLFQRIIDYTTMPNLEYRAKYGIPLEAVTDESTTAFARAALSDTTGERAAARLAGAEKVAEALAPVQDAAYKLAAICEDVRDMRMGGVDPESKQAEQVRLALDREVIAVARAADNAHAAVSEWRRAKEGAS